LSELVTVLKRNVQKFGSGTVLVAGVAVCTALVHETSGSEALTSKGSSRTAMHLILEEKK
jgi:hypothetical protein